ncbi:MAG: glycosyltransferase family 4 protein [Patescibacteria group bacterium]|nr:glycosyltransferase family 4 protein [Patescibacteria group bacterium]MCL5432102.1 glycosyltransferase family 4 protein [Patescibacteria group bacterium]
MKVVLLLFNMPLSKPCGSARFTVQVANKLTDLGHDVTVIANTDADNTKYDFRYVQVNTPPYGSWKSCLTNPDSFLETTHKYAQTLFDLQVKYGFDILHVQHLLFSTLVATIYKDIHCRPFVATCHGTETFETGNNTKMKGYFRYAANADFITADSNSIVGDVRKFVKYPASKIAVINTAVDVNKFKFIKSTRRAIRNRLGFSTNDKVILFAGRLVKEKGVLEIPIIFKELIKPNKNIKLLIVGDGPEKKQLLSNLHGLKVPHSLFRLTGFISQDLMPDYYMAGDIFLMPSLWNEPFATSALEAMACKCPVIAYDNGGIAHALKDNGYKWLVCRRGNKAELINKTTQLLTDKGRLSGYQKSLRAFVQNNYTWDISVAKLIKIYEECIAKTKHEY